MVLECRASLWRARDVGEQKNAGWEAGVVVA
jgi:hypothetical protein